MDRKPDLLTTLKGAGVALPGQVGRPFFVLCPFHDDRKNPNMRVDPDQGVFYCHACGAGGDAISFVGLQLYGPSFNNRDPTMFREVIAHIEGKGIPQVEYSPPRHPKEINRDIVQVLTLTARIYHLALMGKAGREARQQLQSRRIDLATFRKLRLGYAVPGSLVGALAGYPPSLRHAAEEAGLFIRDQRGKPKELLARRIIFPDLMRNGSVKHMVGRSVNANTRAAYKYFALSGLPKTIWGLARASKRLPVILTESIPDAVNLLQMGFQGAAVGGTGIASNLVNDLDRFRDIAILPQNDARGREAVRSWVEVLPRARTLDHPYKADEKDFNDQVRRYGLAGARDALVESLERAGIAIELVPSTH